MPGTVPGECRRCAYRYWLTAGAYTFNKRKAVMGKRTVGTITLSGGSVVLVECLLKVP